MIPASPVLPMQQAIYARLTEDAAFTALVSGKGVYDHVPEDKPFDFVVLGEVYELPDNDHEGFGSHVVPTLHIWTEARGFTPALTIEREIRRLLDHQPDRLHPDGHRVVAARFEYLQTLRSTTPNIRRVTARYRFTTEQE